jgi:hypothetical protein
VKRKKYFDSERAFHSLRSTAVASEIVGPALSPTSINRTLDDAGFKSLRAMATSYVID